MNLSPRLSSFAIAVLVVASAGGSMIGARADAQPAGDWASLARYRDANAALGAPKPGEQRVVFYGNSITDSWAKYFAAEFPGKPYVGRGISGQTTPQMLIRFRQDVIALRPAAAVILAGTNDIAGNTGPSTLEMIEDNLVSMTDLAQANGIRVVLSSVLPVFDYPWKPGLEPAPKIVALNTWMKAYAAAHGTVYLDYHTAMVDARGGLPSSLSADGVHPNEAGYRMMAPLAEHAIAEAMAGVPGAPLAMTATASEGTSARRQAMPATNVRGVVFFDRNGNGTRDPGETGIAGVAVSNQDTVVVTDASGTYHFVGAGTGIAFVSVPDGWQSGGSFWRALRGVGAAANPPGATATIDFPLTHSARGNDFLFVHASDTHISPASAARTVRLRALVDSIKPAFVIITGDLVRDALRVSETEATGYYELFGAQAAQFTAPLYTIPGNHENFGIERTLSHVSPGNPLYGRAMYHHFRGPDYYSFNAGGIHFVGLNSVDIDDQWYYGHVDSLQLAWLTRDLAAVPATTPVVTFNHIPFYSAMESVGGYDGGPPAPSVITVNGVAHYRHTVWNAAEVLARIKGHPYPLALAGHIHVREQLRYEGVPTRFDQVSAIVGPTPGPAGVFPSGITVYRVHQGRVDDGRFIPLGVDAPRP